MNKKALIVGVLMFAGLNIAGCQQAATPASKTPEEIISAGMKKLSEVKASSLDFSLKAELKGPEGQKPEKVNFMISMNGGSDMTNIKDPRLNMKMSGDFSADEDGGSAEGEVRMNKDALFMNLMKLDTKGAVQLPAEMKAQIVSKWWKLPVPPEALEELTKVVPSGDDANLTEGQKKVKKAFESTKFFKNAQLVDTQTVMNEQSDHYTAMLDKKAFQDFMLVAAEAEGNTLSESEKKEIVAALEKIEFNGDVFVGKESGVVNKIAGTLKLTGSTSEPTGEFKIEFVIGNINKAVNVEVPADATDVPVDLLMSGLMLGTSSEMTPPVSIEESKTVPTTP